MPSDPRSPRLVPDLASGGEKHRELQKVNERLRELVASLKTEQERLAEARASSLPTPTPPPMAGSEHAAIDLEKKRLVAELALAREAIDHASAERERLRLRLADIEAENRRICDEYVAVEEKSSELAQLFVALDRIHGALTRDEVLGALQEIVINLIGTEELAVLEVRGDRLAPIHTFGVDPEPLRDIALGAGTIGRTAATGVLHLAGRGEPTPEDRDLTACVPLKVGDRVYAVLAIFRLLGHKPGLTEADHAVFELLSSHAGIALHLRAQTARPAAAG